MSNNARDMQFQGWASLLLDELLEASIVEIQTPFQDDWLSQEEEEDQ
jgi:hypothetical protein